MSGSPCLVDHIDIYGKWITGLVDRKKGNGYWITGLLDPSGVREAQAKRKPSFAYTVAEETIKSSGGTGYDQG